MSNADVKKEALEIVEDLVSTFRMHDSSCKDRIVKYGESCVFSGCGNCMNAMCKALKNKLNELDTTADVEQQDGVIALPKDHDGVPCRIYDDVYNIDTGRHYRVKSATIGETNQVKTVVLLADNDTSYRDDPKKYTHKPPRTCADIIADVMDADKPFSVEAAVNEAYEIGRRDGANDAKA